MINIWFDLFTVLLRFLTDANLGVEKLLVCKPLKGTCMSRTSLKASDVSSELSEIIQPMGVLMVKGWTRGLALQTILMAAFEDDSFLQARLFAIIHVVYFFISGTSASCLLPAPSRPFHLLSGSVRLNFFTTYKLEVNNWSSGRSPRSMLRLWTLLTLLAVWHHWLLKTEALALLNICLCLHNMMQTLKHRLLAGLQETHCRWPTYAVNPTALHFSIKIACFRNMAVTVVSWRRLGCKTLKLLWNWFPRVFLQRIFQFLINPAFRQAWNNVAEFQECFQIGKKESQAAVNLLNEVDDDITEQLITAVSNLG